MASLCHTVSFRWRMFGRQHRVVRRLLIILAIVIIICVLYNIHGPVIPHVNHPSDLPSQKEFSAFLVVLILTGPKYFERRDAIRETWLSNIPGDVKVLFAIGTSGLESEEVGTLLYENSKYEDLLLLPHLKDSYFNLTLKVLQSFQWLEQHVTFDFVLKADDDTYARIDVLHKELKEMTAQRVYWGFFDGRARVKRSGQWEEKQWVLCDRYLPHAKGGGYILSSDLVDFIGRSAPFLQIFNSEDVAVGTWLAGLAISRIHDPRFDSEFVSRGCSNKYIVTHKQDLAKLREHHQNLLVNNKLCTEEYKTRNSYIYKWDVPPSSCCVRNDSSII